MAKQIREIVRIDSDKCDGCGLCVPDCAEGAIQVIDGKARLVAENLCDGLGNCLGTCPKGAITIEQRPADEFDRNAVEAGKRKVREGGAVLAASSPARGKPSELPCGCPGTMMRKLTPVAIEGPPARDSDNYQSRLGHWPVQLTLLPAAGDMWRDADVLIAADCVGFAMPGLHERLLAGGTKTLAIACPKLDDIEPHIEKLTSIFANGGVRTVAVAHVAVPCCGGIVTAVKQALERSGRTDIPLRDLTVSVEGSIVCER